MIKARGSGPDGGQDRIDGQEGLAVCLVGLASNHLLRAAPLWPNAQFGSLLPTTGPLEGSTQNCENWLSEFFGNRDAVFYERGIMKLASRWQQVYERNGAYLT